MKPGWRSSEKKEELDGYSIDNEVIEYIARNVKSNIRELEGSLNKIMAYANLEKSEINLALAEKVLKDIISPNEKRVITPELITDIVADHFDLTPCRYHRQSKKQPDRFPKADRYVSLPSYDRLYLEDHRPVPGRPGPYYYYEWDQQDRSGTAKRQNPPVK